MNTYRIDAVGQMVTITEVDQENVYAYFKGKNILIFDGKMWVYKYY